MSSGEAVIDGWISKLRAMPKEVRAEKFVDVVREDLTKSIAAGTSPDGTPWPQRKEGGRALAGAAGALHVPASGNTVFAVVRGPEAIHNFGTTKDPKRQILPETPPARLVDRLKKRAVGLMRKALGL